MARLPPPSSSAAASAPFWFRSAMTMRAPSRAKSMAISVPMPLAAPVTMATLFSRRMALLPVSGSAQIVVDDLAEPQGQIGDDVRGRDHLEYRQLGNRRQGVGVEIERARTRPRAIQFDVLEVVFDNLADARASVHMGNDLEEEVGRGE